VIYRLEKSEVGRIAEALAGDYRLFGPVRAGDSGQVFFAEASRPEEIDLQAPIPSNPPKHILFPQLEPILSFSYGDSSGEVNIDSTVEASPKALIGLRSCDLEGLLCLDRFFLGQEYADEVFLTHRKKAFIVSNSCTTPFQQCFCVCTDSGPAAREGFDLNLTELAGEYLVEVGSEKGAELVRKLDLPEAAPNHLAERREVLDRSISLFDALATENKAWISRVTNRITCGFIREETWELIGEQCFECGACSFVCPSCSCFNIEDRVLAEGEAVRLRCWDSCSYEGYTRMAGDHNPRKPVEDRRNKRFFCKLSYSQSKKYLRPGCVGCGRCAWVCPGDIGLPNVVTSIRRELTK